MDIDNIYDVIVVGGGISGAMASVAAGRDGAKVLLVEQYGYAGGMLTAAGVGPMMTFHAGSKQVIKGLTSELIDRLIQKKKSPGHIPDTSGYTYSVTPFDSEAMKYELDLMLTEAGVEILFHTMLADVNVLENTISNIVVCNKAGLSELKAKIYIDATGDADLSAWAGVPFTKGREGDGKCQPMTTKFKMLKVDIEKIKDYIKSNPDDFPFLKGDTSVIDKASRLSIGGFVSIVKKAKKQGRFTNPRESVLFFETNNPGEVIINTSRIIDHDSASPKSLTSAEIEGREQVNELVKFFKDSMPGFENAIMTGSGPNVGVRSSRQIKGLYTLCANDLLSFTKFDDAIACCGYPIDVHPSAGEKFVDHSKHFNSGDYYSIPYRCLVNDKIENLITVGRCISASFEAQAAMRTTPTVGAIGHAGGLAASIASKNNIAVKDVCCELLREKLLSQGAYL